MFKHLLLPTDGSDLSLRAIDTGIALAASLGADIYAFHVVMPLPAFYYMAEVIPVSQEVWLEDSADRGETYLQEVHKRASAAGVPCRSGQVDDNRPHTAIAAASSRESCDLIVMASHGWRGIDRLLLGSETQKILINCDVPVLVCH